VSEGLAMPVEAGERLERSLDPALAERLAQLVAEVRAPVPPTRSPPRISDHKATILTRLRAMQAEGLSLQKMADRFNTEGTPTLSGRGAWKKGTISNLLRE